MNVGIYDRWLSALGGGEQHSLALAEALGRAHAVTVISHVPVSRDDIRARLGLDCARLNFATIPDQPAALLGPLTADYDFFINASQGDLVPSRARHSALLVFFPLRIDLDAAARARAGLGRLIRGALLTPEYTRGIFGSEQQAGVRFRRLAPAARITIPGSRLAADLGLALAAGAGGAASARVAVDGREAARLELPADGTYARCSVRVPASPRPRAIDIQAADAAHSAMPLRLADLRLDDPRQRLYRWLFERAFKGWGQRLRAIQPGAGVLRRALDSYGLVWANSRYTQTWISRYWQREASVLAPLVQVERFSPGPKRHIILSVGRFFAGSHNKKHAVMIDAFKQLCAAGLTGWELHLAGSVGEEPADQDYLAQISAQIVGHPIHLHISLSADTLVSLYERSAIYWHAGGYGEQEGSDPIRSEHFGITTVEAMAAGCVPIVIARGGQPEIVSHGTDGLLWRTLAELRGHTLAVIEDGGLRAALADAARAGARRYDREHFEARVAQLTAALDA